MALVPAGLLARQSPPKDLHAAAEQVARFFRADPQGAADLFTPGFLAQVPPAKLEELLQQLHQQLGGVTAVELLKQSAPNSGVFTFHFEKGYTAPVTLAIETGKADHYIVGLLIGPPQKSQDSLTDILAAMKALPGQVSFAAEELPAGAAPRILAQLQPNQELAIGSAFKLYVLGTLDAQIAAGKRRWDRVVPLSLHSLPGGQMQSWPLGSPVTLQTLASMMISISDNTAADQLLHTLGRSQVEAMLAPMGHTQPGRNQPFLSTAEMFQLKYGGPDRLAAYLAATPDGRRAMLAKLPQSVDQAALTNFTSAPRDVDTLEWFASAHDLCAALAWFQPAAHATARTVLAINPGLPSLTSQWDYVGYKGGSEPGVLSGNFLLRSSKGRWFAVSGIWNNPRAAVDETQWFGLLARAIAQLPKD
jgi:beta-lactamase class A